MAKDNNDISDLVKKCKILLLDIEGTTTSISFVKDKLFPYAEQNVKSFLESFWEDEEVKGAVAALRKLALEDKEKNVEGAVAIPGEDESKDAQIEGLVKSVKWQMAFDRKAGPMKELQGLIWKVGYDKGDIKGHVYDDVSTALELWCSLEGQKVYIYSSGSVNAQKLLFRHSMVGDLLPHIEGHFDTAVGAKQEAASYAAIAEKIGCKPEEILFLTDIVQEAEAARKSGMQAALVSREGNAPLPADAVSFPVLHSFEQLTVTNKRKPDPQVEEVPAKIPKTEALDEVKTATGMESEVTPKANGGSKEIGAAEKMDVEESSYDVAETKAENVANILVETSTEKVAIKDVPMVDAATDPAFVTDMKTVAVNTNSTEGIKETAMKDATTETVDTNAPIAESAKENDFAAKVEVAEMEAEIAPAPSNPMDTLDEKATEAAIKAEDSAKLAAQSNSEISPAVKGVVDSHPEESKKPDGPIVEASAVPESMEVPIDESKTVETKTEETATKVVDTPAVEVAPVKSSITTDAVEAKIDDAPVAPPKTQEASAIQSVKSAGDSGSETNSELAKDSKVAEADAHAQDVAISKPVSKVTSANESSIADEASTAEPTAEKVEEMIVEDVTEIKGVLDVPVCEIEPVVEENVEKTDANETETMEAEDTEKVKTVTEPKEPAESTKDQGSTSDTENVPLTIITEVKDITDDKQSLSEVPVNDIIEDLDPIVEEPSPMEEIDALQNAGDVLEKECDEILSKVQDVTNLDFIPVKSLHTITEEMETDNIDTSDIVEGILDTEMELNIKPCEDIDPNVVQEITEATAGSDAKTDNAVMITDKPCNSSENTIEEKIEVSTVAKDKTENAQEAESVKNSQATAANLEPAVKEIESENKSGESKPKVETETEAEESISGPQGSKNDTKMSVDEPAGKINDSEKKAENNEKTAEVAQKETEIVTQDAKTEANATETKVNGKANGDTVGKVNGNSNNDDELTSRLSGDDCKKEVNGANKDLANAEKGQGDNKVEPEIPDIKVKAIATDESRPPIEQPTEA